MSLSEQEQHVLDELERDLGGPSLMTRLCLVVQASRVRCGGLLMPVLALAVGSGLLAGGFAVSPAASGVMIAAGVVVMFYALYGAACAFARRADRRHRRPPPAGLD